MDQDLKPAYVDQLPPYGTDEPRCPRCNRRVDKRGMCEDCLAEMEYEQYERENR